MSTDNGDWGKVCDAAMRAVDSKAMPGARYLATQGGRPVYEVVEGQTLSLRDGTMLREGDMFSADRSVPQNPSFWRVTYRGS